MILRTSSKMDGPRSRSKPIRDSERDILGEIAGDSQCSLRRSSLLSPASESRLKPRFGSSGPQPSDMESSEEASDKEPAEGTRCGRTAMEVERERLRQGSLCFPIPFSHTDMERCCVGLWWWFCCLWTRDGCSSKCRRGGLGGGCTGAMNTGMEMVVLRRELWLRW